ncbi:MAG: hypothetical protein ACKVKG_16660 [Alphaproteobacteria bacterium]
MAPSPSNVKIRVLDSVTKLDPSFEGQVLVAGSHGAVYAAYLAAKGGVRGVILNDAGLGKDRAGVSGLAYLDLYGVAGATIAHTSARIGDGADMMARGIISHINETARALGCASGQSCDDCAALMQDAAGATGTPPVMTESRFQLEVGPPDVWGLDSASLALPEDTTRILIVGSHGQALGGRPETALRQDALGAVFHDAGIGVDDAGVSRLPALDQRNIPAATVAADSARIGDARSIYEDGVLSRVNDTAATLGVKAGMRTADFIKTVRAANR